MQQLRLKLGNGDVLSTATPQRVKLWRNIRLFGVKGQGLIPVERQENRQIAVTLAHRIGAGADAAQIADTVARTWQEIDAALSSIIGQGGVAALYKRGLHLTGSDHPWLAGLHEGDQTTMNLEALKSALKQQSSVDAAAGGGALLQTFYELLASMVGPSLTEQLLRSVWANDMSGSSAQDTSS